MKKIILAFGLVALFVASGAVATNNPNVAEEERIVLFTTAPQNWDRIERGMMSLYNPETQTFPTSFLSHLVCKYNPLEAVKEYLQKNSLDKGLCGDIFITYNRLGNVITKDDFLTRATSGGGLSFPVGRELENFVVRIRGSEGSSEQRLKRLKTWAHQIHLSMDQPDPISVKAGPGGEGGSALAVIVPDPLQERLEAALARIEKLESQTVVTSGDFQEVQDMLRGLLEQDRETTDAISNLIQGFDRISDIISNFDIDWLPGFKQTTESDIKKLKDGQKALEQMDENQNLVFLLVFSLIIFLFFRTRKKKEEVIL
ncbi:MAG: hypothetical protein H6779_01785 [Candidatus Nomurabacteria bacterium]|nr:hypothetical protein [Candidatus Nomurabacteria bacterium]USN88157.1 MAG: hypothetical protein H6779_01785 [Candidatus Nomurabacteria bacterium]